MYLKNHKNIDPERIRIHLICGCVGGGFLDNFPHRRILDMNAVCAFRFDNPSEFAYLDNRDAEQMGLTGDELVNLAMDNSLRHDGYFTEPLLEVLGFEPPEGGEQENAVYVLTNRERFFGSSALCFSSVLKNSADKAGGDCYIIPSSVHECLLIPAQSVAAPSALREMVYHINRTQLASSELLSDSIYFYSHKEGALRIDIS